MPLIVPVVSTPAAPPAESTSAGAAASQSETGPRFSDALSRAGKAAPSPSASADSAKAQKPTEASSSDAKVAAHAQGKADSSQAQSSAPSQDSEAANASASASALQASGALEAAMAASQSGKTLPQDDRKTASKDANPAAVPGSVLAAMLQAPIVTSVGAPVATATAETKDAKTLPTSALLAGPQNDPLTDRQANFGRAGAQAGGTTDGTTKAAESLPAWMQNLTGSAADAAQPSRFAALHQAITTASDLSALQTTPSKPADSTPSVASPAQIGQALTLGMPQANPASQAVWAATVPAHMGSPDWGQAMNQQVLLAAQGQQQFATLHLNPPQLGPLEVHLQMHDGQIQAQFVSAHAVVRQAVEAALPQLRDVFAGAGLSLGQTSVGTQGGQGDRQQARSQRGTSGLSAIADIAAAGAPGASAAQVLRWQQGLVNTYV